MKKATIKIANHEISRALLAKLAALAAIWLFLVHGHDIVPTTTSVTQHLFGP
ncbi:MAG: hypothetical protein KGL10_07695 [Alphaproteobacteria bacterium]|nr:hypothetical protein [Alphaproteobacteria bacterium]